MSIDELNRLSEAEATTVLGRCCGSVRWVERMVIDRPFESLAEMLEISDRIWEECDVDDYMQAFEQHARDADPFATASSTDPTLLDRLRQGHAAYQDRFGHAFIAFSPGKTAVDMLSLLEARLANRPEHEVSVAAAEHNKHVRARLRKLLV